MPRYVARMVCNPHNFPCCGYILVGASWARLGSAVAVETMGVLMLHYANGQGGFAQRSPANVCVLRVKSS